MLLFLFVVTMIGTLLQRSSDNSNIKEERRHSLGLFVWVEYYHQDVGVEKEKKRDGGDLWIGLLGQNDDTVVGCRQLQDDIARREMLGR